MLKAFANHSSITRWRTGYRDAWWRESYTKKKEKRIVSMGARGTAERTISGMNRPPPTRRLPIPSPVPTTSNNSIPPANFDSYLSIHPHWPDRHHNPLNCNGRPLDVNETKARIDWAAKGTRDLWTDSILRIIRECGRINIVMRERLLHGLSGV